MQRTSNVITRFPMWLRFGLPFFVLFLIACGHILGRERIILLSSQIEQTAVSPDGKYRATLVDGSTGAWDNWDEVFLERNGQSLGAFNLSRRWADGDGDIDRLSWSAPHVLVILYRTDWGKGKADARWGNVRIVHRAPTRLLPLREEGEGLFRVRRSYHKL